MNNIKKIIINDISIYDNKYSVDFSIDPEERLLKSGLLTASYPQKTPQDVFFPFMLVLSLTLPILAIDNDTIIIESDFSPDKAIYQYWSKVFKRLQVKEARLIFENKRHDKAITVPASNNYRHTKMGLLFGGGVESVFALSMLKDFDIDLISIIGKGWMNNDAESDGYAIKKNVEAALVQEQKVRLSRIETNARSLLNADDLCFNRYISGLLFYFLSLPFCLQNAINILYKSSEQEEAMNFTDHDLSLRAPIIPYLSFPSHTLFLPIFNSFPKILMLNELRYTPFLKYVYSCFHNKKQRWCGECSKCGRISAFFERLGIDKKIVGMQDGIISIREDGPITKYYWEFMDKLFPLPCTQKSERSVIIRKADRSLLGRAIIILKKEGPYAFVAKLKNKIKKLLKVKK